MQTLYLNPNDSINDALKRISEAATVYLADGVYYEKVKIQKSDVTLIGSSRDNVKITFDDYAKKIHSDGLEFNTFRTYTLGVFAPRVALKNLTVENSSGDPVTRGQAVALHVCADEFLADGCAFLSMQDTIFNGGLPNDLIERYIGFLPDDERTFCGASNQTFVNCLVCGTVDFIFGCGNARYLDCEIRSVSDGRDHGFVAAPAHASSQEDSLTFVNCRFTSQGVADSSIFLARPWRDYGRATFVDCHYGKHIHPLGFDKWNDTERDKTAKFYEGFSDGSFPSSRVAWAKRLTKEETLSILSSCRPYFLK